MNILQIVRTLGFGSALGAGLGAWVFLLFPEKIPGAKTLYDVMIAGGLVGAGLCQVIERYVLGILLRPALQQISFYWHLLKIRSLRNITSHAYRTELTKKVVEKHLLEDKSN